MHLMRAAPRAIIQRLLDHALSKSVGILALDNSPHGEGRKCREQRPEVFDASLNVQEVKAGINFKFGP
jgi:hypothetical protein